MELKSPPVYHSVYKIVCSIPPGKVLTYGLISNMLDRRLSAQAIGWALKALPSPHKISSIKVPARREAADTKRASCDTPEALQLEADQLEDVDHRQRQQKNLAPSRKEDSTREILEKKQQENLIPYHSGNVPWHRVINSKGTISTSKISATAASIQQTLLESEGIIFDETGSIDLKKYLWTEGLRCSNFHEK